ncbi:MAG: hypothetical protein U0232_18275 [Thermomicrobiales bacterium]
MAVAERTVESVRRAEESRWLGEVARWWRAGLHAVLSPLAQPLTAGLIALVVYLIRASLNIEGFKQTNYAYFNNLADAFLHGQLHLRVLPPELLDLIAYKDNYYMYWPPFPSVVLMPVVKLFGVGVTDITYTAIFGAITVGLTAKLLAVLNEVGIAPLSVERRALLVITVAFGSVVLILSPVGKAWFTAQLIGWGCVLLATIAALTLPGRWGYFLTGLALGCALTTRNALLFNGIWLAYFMLQRDWNQPARERAVRVAWGLAPVVVAIGLLAWYNQARFGSPTETGLKWHNVAPFFEEDFKRYGVFNLHYLPTNLKQQFWTFPVFTKLEDQEWLGGSLFWMSPTLLAAPWAILRHPRSRLVWALAISAAIVYIPIGLLMGTGWVTYGPRYLLDLMVPILVLAAIGMRRWPVSLLIGLTVLSCAFYIIGSRLWMLTY